MPVSSDWQPSKGLTKSCRKKPTSVSHRERRSTSNFIMWKKQWSYKKAFRINSTAVISPARGNQMSYFILFLSLKEDMFNVQTWIRPALYLCFFQQLGKTTLTCHNHRKNFCIHSSTWRELRPTFTFFLSLFLVSSSSQGRRLAAKGSVMFTSSNWRLAWEWINIYSKAVK